MKRTSADGLEGLTVLSMEQALTLPYLTFRLAGEGMRVVRLENPLAPDPNRNVGDNVLGEPGMNSYFLPYNAGKESVTLNLAEPRGRELLHEMIRRLPVDVFAANTRPKNFERLGVDYETLRRIRPEIIWLSITGFGPESDETAYDPVLQARLGWMDLTGEAGGAPQVFGLPMVDLGTSEHAYGAVMKALFQRERTGTGSRIDLAMARSAFAWMILPVGMAASFGTVTRRRGSTHPFFGPVSVYPTKDGFAYVAVGSDRQWDKLAGHAAFAALARDEYRTNAGRMASGDRIHREMAEATKRLTTEGVLAALRELGVPVSRVATLTDVLADPCVADRLRARDTKTGKELELPPPPLVSGFLARRGLRLPFPPRMGEHTAAILGELGRTPADVEALRAGGVL
ncbi:MAG: CoA transferase [Candidatus Brocadiae bacterium]|nr:CoA transferase [Candidatus Brocadiia bacterium]